MFLDYGCGKGRTLAVAAMRPFKRVIGVELDNGLLAIARKNLARLGNKVRCGSVSLQQNDAAQFEVPDDVNAVFMFNPFSGDVMTAVIDQLKASLHRRPRSLTLFFYFPPHHEVDPFEELDWWRRKAEIAIEPHLFMRLLVYQPVLELFAKPKFCE